VQTDLEADREVANTLADLISGGPLMTGVDDQDSRSVRRTTTQPVRSIKAAQSRKAAHVS
jgi:hypothetical protein